MSGIATRWVVSRDCSVDGPVHDEDVARWVAEGRDAYLDPETGEVRELGADVRAELIGLEHAARYLN